MPERQRPFSYVTYEDADLDNIRRGSGSRIELLIKLLSDGSRKEKLKVRKDIYKSINYLAYQRESLGTVNDRRDASFALQLAASFRLYKSEPEIVSSCKEILNKILSLVNPRQRLTIRIYLV